MRRFCLLAVIAVLLVLCSIPSTLASKASSKQKVIASSQTKARKTTTKAVQSKSKAIKKPQHLSVKARREMLCQKLSKRKPDRIEYALVTYYCLAGNRTAFGTIADEFVAATNCFRLFRKDSVIVPFAYLTPEGFQSISAKGKPELLRTIGDKMGPRHRAEIKGRRRLSLPSRGRTVRIPLQRIDICVKRITPEIKKVSGKICKIAVYDPPVSKKPQKSLAQKR